MGLTSMSVSWQVKDSEGQRCYVFTSCDSLQGQEGSRIKDEPGAGGKEKCLKM